MRRILAGAAIGSLSASGCTRLGADLIVATDWAPAEVAGLEAALAPMRIAWVRPTGSPDPTRLLADGLLADAILGGPIAVYRGLAGEGRLAAIDASGLGPTWVVSRRSPLGWATAGRPVPGEAGYATAPASWRDLGDPGRLGRVALGDPRLDPISLACLASRLREGPWAEAYAEWVLAAGNAAPIAGEASAPLAALSRGEADVSPTAEFRVRGVPGLEFVGMPGAGDWVEGAAILADARNPDAARAFIRAIIEGSGDEPASESAEEATPTTLLADLLGATLVDAQPELVASIGAIRRNPDRPGAEQAAFWLVQPPPWPPASITVLRARPEGDALIDALAEQLTPDLEARTWLRKYWGRPEGPIDDSLLTDLADPARGRLADEPRFRAWLRGEWVAWARQRYRRAERLAEGRVERP